MNSETEKEDNLSLRRRGIYLLPNLFTTAGLFAGFYAIIAATKGLYVTASVSIFIAMIADGFDGRIARLTNTSTPFGVEYDSLSDMLSFGVAPSVLVYCWALSDLSKLGWMAAFLYAAGTALRLARFNTQAVVRTETRYFQGLSCTAAAGVMAGMVWCASEYSLKGHSLDLLAVLMTIWLAFSMVSNIRYYSIKQLDFSGKVPFVYILIVVLLFACVAIDPAQVLFVVFFGYALSGPLTLFWRWYRRDIDVDDD